MLTAHSCTDAHVLGHIRHSQHAVLAVILYDTLLHTITQSQDYFFIISISTPQINQLAA